MKKNYLTLFFLCFSSIVISQDIELYQQFNGHYDYTAIGATLNSCENNICGICEIEDSATANLTMQASQTVVAAYLYWAGSGSGDFEVELNNQPISAERSFSRFLSFNSGEFEFFSAFADITTIIQNTGNANYTVSEIDLQNAIIPYCNNATNFGGWAIIVIYEDNSLPLNQLSIFDGLQGVSVDQPNLTIQLNNLSVIDNNDAKIGFLAWEGDSSLGIEENLFVNGNEISNPPLNPAGNAFNGTNSFTNSSELYNMDLDFYNIENNINIGDTQATIQLHTGNGFSGDLILINNVITVLNSILPDPSPEINAINTTCFSSEVTINYTVNNVNCTGVLPPNTPILFYVEGELIGQTQTQNEIPIDGSESGSLTVNLPVNASTETEITMIVNNDLNGDIVVPEINEDNNETSSTFFLPVFEIAIEPNDLEACDETDNNDITFFDLTQNSALITGNQTNLEVNYFENETLAESNLSFIDDPSNYPNTENPQEIFVRLTSEFDDDCYLVDSFMLIVNETPLANQGANLTACEYNAETGTAFFDLTENNDLIVDGQSNTELNIYSSEENAINNEGEIQNPTNYQNIENPQNIYVKLSNANHPECYSISTFQLQVTSISMGEIITEFKECDPDGEKAFFDLTQNTSLAIDGQENISIHYFETETQAENNVSWIDDPEDYENIANPQQVFVRISSTENEDCYLIDSFLLSVYAIPVTGEPDDLTSCDDYTNDEIVTFNLTENDNTIIANQNNTILNYYLTEEDALNNENEIINITNYTNTSNPQTIYARLSNSSYQECYTLTNFQLNVLPVTSQNSNESLLLCDLGFNQAYFDITEIENQINLTSSQTIEGYYLNEEDASFQQNPINSPEYYRNTTAPQTIYMRIEEDGKCYQILSFSISVENCPPIIPDGYSPNGDGMNDTFEIKGLYDIFENFELKIFNRYGTLIYQGNNNTPEWDGTSTEGINNVGSQLPSGTYFYILNLNDANYNLYRGWVYLNR